MLELDKLFRTYLEHHGDVLDAQQLAQFTRLLEYQDQDLFDAFSGKQPLPDETLDRLFTEMQDRVKA
jgi:succinate dehydrogenase flavin-adding protein (antitoxin of CptAB toxin-antitoxin module)